MNRTALLAPVVLIAVVTACSAQNNTPAEQKARVVDVATDVVLADDGTVTWVDGKIDDGGPFEPTVVAVDKQTHSAEFAEEVELLTPQGCQEPYGDLKIDEEGLGQVRCTFNGYLLVDDHYAPRIWLDAKGQITKIADRYHP